MAAVLATVYFGLTVATWIQLSLMAYQIVQARKMKKQAQAAADARKGYELVVEGEGVTLPVVYGRAKVGGVRSYHNTSNNFVMATPNSDKVFSSSGFNANISGRANEFLFFQQALCQGPINRVYDIVLEESRYLDDPDLSTTQTITTSEGDGDNTPYTYSSYTSVKSGLRIDLHYGDTPIADSIMSANNPERVNSVFTQVKDEVGLAYASVCIKLDRDDPALSGVPTLQFFLEGKKVKSLIRSGTVGNYTYQLSSTREYSNNPAFCLLDYLLDKSAGKSLDTSVIDLESFYNAKVICDTVVLNNASVGGKIYKPTIEGTGAEGVTTGNTRNVRLYECNAIIDTQKPIRENVEAILATMGDARLIWSGGKYKLSLQYPASNSLINLAATLNDDDLVIDDNVSINWPSSSERLNQCVVRFHNESENFKEDTVSWPPKESGISLRGIGGFKYPQSVDDAWNDSTGGVLLKKYSVWSGSGSSFDQTWKFFVKETGLFTFEFTGDNSATATITTTSGTVLYSGSATNWQATTIGSVSLVKDTEYRVRLTAQDSGGSGKGVAAKLSKGSFVYWTTRSDNYTGLISIANSNAVYLQMKAEDNSLELETDIFADGITDYYHALAKAEELVRTSRTAFGIKFKYVLKDKFLEPGDFIKFSSQTLGLGVDSDLFLRVNEVKITDESLCEVNATRFDYTQLSWNVADNEYIKALNVYSFAFNAPTNLQYIAETSQILNSSGRLQWTGIDNSQLDCYITYYHFPGNVTQSGEVIWTELGRTTDTQYILPPLTLTQTIFGVRALSKGGKLSDIATTTSTVITPAVAATAYILSLSNDSISLTCDKDGVPVAGQLPKTVTIKVTKGETVYTTGVTYAITPTGCTATLTDNLISITAIASQFAKIVVTATIGTLVLTKEVSISKSTAGLAAITGFLTNEASTVSADALGVVSSFTGTGGTFKVLDGLADKTGDAAVTYSVNSSSGVTVSIAASGVYTVSAMSADTGTATLRAVYNTVTIDKVYSIAKSKTGSAGNKSVTVYLYQWSTVQPSNPTATSSYDWTTSSNSAYTGANSWLTTVDTNPGTPLMKLWIATKTITALSTATTTSVDWTTGVNVSAFTQNGSTGTPGLNATQVKLYQTAFTIPSGPTGTSSYTWATSSYSYGGGNGWSATPPTSSVGLGGQTLWVATVSLNDSAANTQTTINWVTASITAESYYAINGTPSTVPGPSGASARVAYAVTTTTPSSSPSTVTVSGDNLPTTGSWFSGITWQTNSPASLTEGQFLYQVDGLYNPATGVNSTTWQGIPYLSSLKVGNLQAISTNTGQLTVTDTIKVGVGSSTTNGVLITTNGLEVWNNSKLRVKLGLL